MESRKIIFHETAAVGAGTLAATGLMVAIFGLLGQLDASVWLGALVGLLVAVGNFFIMAVTASLAANKAEKQDVAGGKSLLQGSYFLRLLVIFAILFLCVKTDIFHIIALVLPLLFVRPVVTIVELLRKKEGSQL